MNYETGSKKISLRGRKQKAHHVGFLFWLTAFCVGRKSAVGDDRLVRMLGIVAINKVLTPCLHRIQFAIKIGLISDTKNALCVAIRDVSGDRRGELREPGAVLLDEGNVFCPARGGPGVGPDHESCGMA